MSNGFSQPQLQHALGRLQYYAVIVDELTGEG